MNFSQIKIEAQQGSNQYLINIGNDQGCMLFLKENVLTAPMHIESFYSHVIWDPYMGNLDLKEILSNVQVEVNRGSHLMPFYTIYGNTFEDESKCIVFRQNDADRNILYHEIAQGRLRQGWGYSENHSLFLGKQNFVQSFPHESVQNQWNVLSRMLLIHDGDTVVIPKQPDHHHFLIVKAKLAPGSHTCYEFGEPLENTNDYRHIVHIDSETIQIVHYDSPLTPLIMKRLLKTIAYSSPVNFVRNSEFKQAVSEVFSSTEKTLLGEAHPLTTKLKSISDNLYQEWVKTVRNLTPSDFEKLVKKCMKDYGFSILKSNSYDRKGGDIDLLCTKEIPVDTPFEQSTINLTYCIQIKKHGHLTDSTGVQQLVTMEKNLNLEDSHIVQKILISLADGFTPECQILAKEFKVGLINGKEFAQLYFRSI